jgi:hypothetical protein
LLWVLPLLVLAATVLAAQLLVAVPIALRRAPTVSAVVAVGS